MFVVTDDEIPIVLSALQPANARHPIVVTDGSNVIAVSATQPSHALSPIDETDGGWECRTFSKRNIL